MALRLASWSGRWIPCSGAQRHYPPCTPEDARAHQTMCRSVPFGGRSGPSAGHSLTQPRILPYPRSVVVVAGRPSRASSLSMPAYPASRVLQEPRRSPPCPVRACLPRTDHRTRPSCRPRRRQQHGGACMAQQRAGLLRWARVPSASRKHRSSLARAPRSARSLRCLRSTALGRSPRLSCCRGLTTPRPGRHLESEAVRTYDEPRRATSRDEPRPSRARPPWRRGSGRGRTRA